MTAPRSGAGLLGAQRLGGWSAAEATSWGRRPRESREHSGRDITCLAQQGR